MVNITGASPALPCGVCEATFRRDGVPLGWTVTTFYIGTRLYAQYHLPDCPNGFKSKLPPEESP